MTSVFRRAPGLIRLAGSDRVKWLQGFATAELTTIGPGAGCFAAACNRQGKMIGVFAVRIFDDHLLLETEPGLVAPLLAHFDRHIIMEQVTAEDVTSMWNVFDVVGETPKLPWFHFEARPGGFVSTDRTLGRDGCVFFLEPGAPPPGGAPMDEAAREALRVANGFPRWGADMGPDELPMEAGLEPLAISYSKGCYLGQEVILRLKTYGEPPKRLVKLGGAVASGAVVTAGGEAIGKVTSAAGNSALAYVRKGHDRPGTRVEAGGVEATVAALPWHAFAERPPDRAQGLKPIRPSPA